MLTSLVARVIEFCLRHALAVVVIGIAAAIGAGVYTARHFVINSDISGLLSPDLEWRKRERAFEAEFQRFDLIAVVVEAPTPELDQRGDRGALGRARQGQGEFRDRHQFERGGVLRAARAAVLAQRRAGDQPRRARQGRAADPGSRDRPQSSRPAGGARGRPHRRQAGQGLARRFRAAAEHGGRHA